MTCSCSGLLSLEDFEAHVIKAAHRQDRRLQFFELHGPRAGSSSLLQLPRKSLPESFVITGLLVAAPMGVRAQDCRRRPSSALLC